MPRPLPGDIALFCRDGPRWPVRSLGRLSTVLVAGPSMLPVLRPGDALLVRYGARARPGSLVVARPLARPELLVVKRAVRPLSAEGLPGEGGELWEVAADNPAVAGRGWTGGPAYVLGWVVLRYWPLPPAAPR